METARGLYGKRNIDAIRAGFEERGLDWRKKEIYLPNWQSILSAIYVKLPEEERRYWVKEAKKVNDGGGSAEEKQK